MMKNPQKRWATIFWAMLLVAAWGCYNDAVVFPKAEFTGEASFSNDVIPIFNSDCNTSGCHATGGIKPDLSPSNAYSALTTGGYLNTDAPEESELYRWMTGLGNTPMPPSGTDENNAAVVLAWIEQGALDN